MLRLKGISMLLALLCSVCTWAFPTSVVPPANLSKTAVNELLLKLEPMNPTKDPAHSSRLEGTYEFLYSQGTPGVLGLQLLAKVGNLLSGLVDLKGATLTIGPAAGGEEEAGQLPTRQTEAAVTVSVLGRETTLKIRTTLESESDVRLQEVYQDTELGGRTFPLPAFLPLKRTLFVTYLDDELLISRAASGAPDLLIRQQEV
ncbi:unnamed protein product [Chrysoparadoxa australica]